jgi:hypothetical protein
VKVTVVVPEQLRVAVAAAREQGVDLVAGTGEAEDAELHASRIS